MSGRVALTERSAKGATTEGRKSPIFYDDEVIGFGLQVWDNGCKTFTHDYTVEGRWRCTFIGDHSVWSAKTIRQRTMQTSAVGQTKILPLSN